MKVSVFVLDKGWEVEVPASLIEKAVRYAVSVVGQRETAGMGEGATPEKLAAVKARYARIEAGEWAEGGGRAADPVTRASVALLRKAAIYKKAAPAYKPAAVPGSSDAGKVAAFMRAHFKPEQVAKLEAQAKRVAAAESTKLTL